MVIGLGCVVEGRTVVFAEEAFHDNIRILPENSVKIIRKEKLGEEPIITFMAEIGSIIRKRVSCMANQSHID